MSRNDYLIFQGMLPQAIEGATIWVLNSDSAQRISVQAGSKRCEVKILPVEAEDRSEFHRDATFERVYYEKYIPILSDRLRTIHKLDKPDNFWESMLGMTLLIHISQARRVYQVGQLLKKVNLTIVGSEGVDNLSTTIPIDENEYRKKYQYQDVGDELLIRCFQNTFGIENWFSHRRTEEKQPSKELYSKEKSPILKRAADLVKSIPSSWRMFFREAIVRLLRAIISPKVIMIGVHWARKNRQQLEIRSRGKIQLRRDGLAGKEVAGYFDSNARKILARHEAGFEDFDRYFFSSLEVGAPKTWIEGFKSRYKFVSALLDRLPKVTHIVNESLDEHSLLVMAEAKVRNKITVHCEHNYLQQQYLGNMVWYIRRKIDRYLSLGWELPNHVEIEPAGSYYQWISDQKKTSEDIDVLYITGISMIRPPITSAGYGESGSPNVHRFNEMKKAFLSNLSPALMKRIYYRDYPRWRRLQLRTHYLDNYFFDEFSSKLGVFDREGEVSSNILLDRCKIIVVDYLSTPYLQGLVLGKPMIVLYNRDSYYLDDCCLDFFDELVSAGIFQPDPVAAASLLTNIVDNPNEWWMRDDVQNARNRFLGNNMGNPEMLGKKLLSYAGVNIE